LRHNNLKNVPMVQFFFDKHSHAKAVFVIRSHFRHKLVHRHRAKKGRESYHYSG
jgi:hypothetical protein